MSVFRGITEWVLRFCPLPGAARAGCRAGAGSSGAAGSRPADVWLQTDVAVAGESGHPPKPQDCAAGNEEI